MIHKTASVVKEHIRDNKYTYLSLFIFYIIGIVAGSLTVNELDYNQKTEMTTFFNDFLKLLNNNNVNGISLLKISLLDSIRVIILFWLLGVTVIGLPVYYLTIGIRGFSTGFSSGIIMGVLGEKGVLVSIFCFLPKEILTIPFIIALGVNGIRLTKGIVKNWIRKPVKKEDTLKFKFLPYCFVTLFFSLFILVMTILDAFIAPFTLRLLTFL
ncbi:stage II sporulation protein M [Ruminiclostridium cellulolyticum]|uniref:Stage II sporulation protein M n=1 Tax=Ruminiclostridium cellulolyticum (strain ATCC 35319 / DSM 5812 / JCM 6584 / H10) TaxID=394503 RepID=B8I2W0_RUMCH|nr:stage II sporulation protein M [Ruminiclostridium cellulolyticum]ACL76103.1 stage II sporulation protein M [Ruminiclostridium cellulolyticum H10]